MLNNSSEYFISYYKLNEINKFTNVRNVAETSDISSVSLWSTIDRSKEKSKSDFYSKGLLIFLLLYIVTGKRPSLVKSKLSKDTIIFKVNLYSKDCKSFIDKFFRIYDSKTRDKLFSGKNILGNRYRTSILDLNIFSEIEDIRYLFESVNFIFLDIYCKPLEKNSFFLLRNLWGK